MISDFKTYIIGDREYFRWRDRASGEIMKKDFALSQSLLDYLDLDFVGELHGLFRQAGEHLEEPKYFESIADQHIYFELLRHDPKAAGIGLPVEITPTENVVTYYPENGWLVQEKVNALIHKVFEVGDLREMTIQQKLSDYYAATLGMELFRFEPIPTRMERLDENTFAEVLYPNTAYDLVNFFLREIIRREVMFKTCRCCGRYFPSYVHGNAEYCERIFQDGKTCKEIGAVSMFRARLEEYPAMQMYQRAYKTRFARIKAKRMTKEAFVVWGEQARVYRDKVMAGEMALEEFEGWLKEN